MKVTRVIITGGPSTGKTSLVKQLENDGYNCIHETSREIIQESLASGSDVLPWKDLIKFSERVIQQRVDHYHSAVSKNSKKFTFFDRGIPDVFAYMEYDKIEIPEDFIKLGDSLRYHTKIFITPAWKAIFENDNERVEDFSKAEQLQHFIHNTYKNLGYEVILVPKATIEKRIRFILDHLDE
ncbi:MAG: ATP-binding protein [Flavobacteriales bacterium]|nr:ATP-binding protein [Flavobacteriales bacterium]